MPRSFIGERPFQSRQAAARNRTRNERQAPLLRSHTHRYAARRMTSRPERRVTRPQEFLYLSYEMQRQSISHSYGRGHIMRVDSSLGRDHYNQVGRICRSTRMRRHRALFMPLIALCRRHFSADFTTNMSEFNFRQAQLPGAPQAACRRSC